MSATRLTKHDSVLFLISAVLQVALSRSHKREKRYGPSPANNYTSGSGKRKPWQRKNKAMQDAELGAVGAGALASEKDDKRGSDLTGTTAPVAEPTYGGPNSKYAANEPTLPVHHAGYMPQTTGVTDEPYASHRPSGLTGGETAGIPEMDADAPGGVHHPYVQHEVNPYAEVHGGGYVHSNPESLAYAR